MTNWTKPTGQSTNWTNISVQPTQYQKTTITSTNWTSGTQNPTSFNDRAVTDVGVIMDDLTYNMDSTEVTMDDLTLNIGVAAPTNWT